mgnify:CR=1 FL=1
MWSLHQGLGSGTVLAASWSLSAGAQCLGSAARKKKKYSALEGESVRATQAEHTGSSHHKRVRAHHTNTHTQYRHLQIPKKKSRF